MPNADPRIDAHIRKSGEFAQPILSHLRAVIHEGCPEVVETMKWSMPFFDHHGPMCSFAAFKSHCALRFWKGALVLPEGKQSNEAMGQFGRISSLKDLPPRRALVATTSYTDAAG